MKRFSKYTVIFAMLALLLVLAVGVQSSMAYFTSYAQGEGGAVVTLTHREELTEEVTGLAKAITITNNAEDSQPVFVRARAYVGTEFEPFFNYTPGNGWRDGGDGWWYYDEVLNPGDSTTVLNAALDDLPVDDNGMLVLGDNKLKQNQVNVVVVYESTLALYQYQGNGVYVPFASWETLDSSGHNVVEGGSES